MFLERILESKRREVDEREALTPLGDLRRLAEQAPPTRDFLEAVRRPGLGVIAEVKRASPSRGSIRLDLDAPTAARRYEAGGCVALSVLTDGAYFGARPDDLHQVRAAVSVPVLRKDFLLCDYQIWESRAMGADAVLLIVAALEDAALARLIRLAGDLGMRALVEVHAPEEVERALVAGATVIGINNRDLRTFRVDLEVTRALRSMIPPGLPVVSESGIRGPEDAALVRRWGVDAVLVGEALVSSDDPARLVRAIACSGS